MPELTLDNLVAGLETFSGTYQALDVFIADVAELRAVVNGAGVPGLHANGESSALFQRGAHWYQLELFPGDGVARLTRAAAAPPPPASNAGAAVALGGAAVGAMLGAAVSSKKESLENTATGLLLGLLVGAALGASVGVGPAPPRKVFTLCFDPATSQWRAYDGGLVRWMKEQLAPPSVLADLPR